MFYILGDYSYCVIQYEQKYFHVREQRHSGFYRAPRRGLLRIITRGRNCILYPESNCGPVAHNVN